MLIAFSLIINKIKSMQFYSFDYSTECLRQNVFNCVYLIVFFFFWQHVVLTACFDRYLLFHFWILLTNSLNISEIEKNLHLHAYWMSFVHTLSESVAFLSVVSALYSFRLNVLRADLTLSLTWSSLRSHCVQLYVNRIFVTDSLKWLVSQIIING